MSRCATTSPAGFAIPLADDTDLEMAMLIAEDGDGNYQPIGIAATINEAREIAASHFRTGPGRYDKLYPFRYRLCRPAPHVCDRNLLILRSMAQ